MPVRVNLPRVSLLLKERHPVPEPREQVGGGAPGRSAASDDDVVVR
jgi:hypothetical protein